MIWPNDIQELRKKQLFFMCPNLMKVNTCTFEYLELGIHVKSVSGCHNEIHLFSFELQKKNPSIESWLVSKDSILMGYFINPLTKGRKIIPFTTQTTIMNPNHTG